MTNNGIKIIAFCCRKWGYGGADMAGTIRAQYPTAYRIIIVPCTGRVGADLVMRAFGRGSDGVLIVGWHPGECDYETGNKFAYRSVEYLKDVLNSAGIAPERLRMEFCSSAEGARFKEVATEFYNTIKGLGGNPLKESSS